MTNLSFAEASPTISELNEMMKEMRPEPIFFYPYLKRVLAERFAKDKPQYPMTVKIPKENKYLLKGDYEPAMVITLNEPLMREDGTPVWFCNSSNEIFLRLGYTNCDARYICDQKMDMSFIHAFLGGSSGHGKSVTINAILGGLFYEYAPWELQVHMSDAKITEFKKYGVGHIIPHIATIAATEDPDFVISVLEQAKREMNERAKIFGNLGVSNLKSFRKKTGLAYPRVLVVMDEVESTFKLAGKKAQKIADAIDAFARLGRSSGYHLLMATQNMSSDIPKSAVGQIRIRMCLGANQTVSEAVLGNKGACDNFGRIGRLIVNTEVLNGGDTYPANIEYQTPYITDDNFEQEMEELESIGAKTGYHQVCSFYDEADIKTVDSFRPVMDQALARMSKAGEIGPKKSTVMLGYPAYVTEDEDKLLKVSFDHKDVENLVICSTLADHTASHLHNITYSLRDKWGIFHYSTDTDMFPHTVNAAATMEVREAAMPPLNAIDSLVRRRLFLLYLDGIAKDENRVKFDRKDVESLFAKDGIPKTYWGNGLMCRRASAFYSIQANPKNHAAMWTPVANYFTSFSVYYKECEKYNALVDPITIDNFSKVMIVLGDLSKIIGYGRDNTSKCVTHLKKALQDSNRAGVVYVLYTRSLEGLNDLVSGLRYAIFDQPDTRDWGRMRTEAPASLGATTALFYDAMDTSDPLKKFKRTLLHEDF